MTYFEEVREFKRAYWIRLLARCGHSVRAAAREAGVYRTHAYRMLNQLGIDYVRDSRGSHRGKWGDLANTERTHRV